MRRFTSVQHRMMESIDRKRAMLARLSKDKQDQLALLAETEPTVRDTLVSLAMEQR